MRTEEAAEPRSFNEPEWEWPIDVHRYDRSPHLSSEESEHMGRLVARFTAGGKGWHKEARAALARLLHLPAYRSGTTQTESAFIVHAVVEGDDCDPYSLSAL